MLWVFVRAFHRGAPNEYTQHVFFMEDLEKYPFFTNFSQMLLHQYYFVIYFCEIILTLLAVKKENKINDVKRHIEWCQEVFMAFKLFVTSIKPVLMSKCK